MSSAPTFTFAACVVWVGDIVVELDQGAVAPAHQLVQEPQRGGVEGDGGGLEHPRSPGLVVILQAPGGRPGMSVHNEQAMYILRTCMKL